MYIITVLKFVYHPLGLKPLFDPFGFYFALLGFCVVG